MYRLVIVLEKRTLVHDLKTLELLRTLETESNPKVQNNRFAAKRVRLFYACSAAFTAVECYAHKLLAGNDQSVHANSRMSILMCTLVPGMLCTEHVLQSLPAGPAIFKQTWYSGGLQRSHSRRGCSVSSQSTQVACVCVGME